MRIVARPLLALLLGLAAAVLVACGSGGKGYLDSGHADRLQSDLDGVAGAVSSGDCAGAGRAVGTFANDVSALPASADATLRSSLSDAASTLRTQAGRDCHRQTTTQTTTTTTATTSSTPASTTPTETTATVTSSTATTPAPTDTGGSTATTPSSPGTSTRGAGDGTSGGAGVGSGGGSSSGSGPGSGAGSSGTGGAGLGGA